MPSGEYDNGYRFKIGQKAAEVWTEETTIELFEKMLAEAGTNEEILCFQDVCFEFNVRPSGFDYLIKKFPNLEVFKSDIQNSIIRRINKKALKSDFQVTASIWRMKQLGEVDRQEIKQTGKIDSGEHTVNFRYYGPDGKERKPKETGSSE